MPQKNFPKPLVGKNFGKYKIISKLGKGGMGAVYKAYDLSLERNVALKIILGDHGKDPRKIQRFQKEAQLAARLSHENISPLYEFSNIEGTYFFTMDYVDGRDLQKHVKERGRLTEKEALELMIPATQAVVYAHEQEVIHRDIKPPNIMLDKNGKPLLMDFGLAKQLGSKEKQFTRTGAIVGSPEYMAPEQANEEKDLGPAVDIYALGGVLYFILSGRPVFKADTAIALLVKVLKDRPTPLRSLRPTVSVDLEVVVHKCLEKDPQNRYPSTEALLLDLKAVQRGDPIMARPPDTVEKIRRWIKKNRLLVSVVALCLVVLIAGLWGFWSLQKKAEIEKVIRKADVALKGVSSSAKIEKNYHLSQKLKESLSPEIKKKIRRNIKTYLLARSILNKGLISFSANPQIREKLFLVEREIGLLALWGRIYPLSKSSFEKCHKLKKKDGKNLLARLKKQKTVLQESQKSRIKEIMAILKKSKVAQVIRDEYMTEILRMEGSHIPKALIPYIQKPSKAQRLFAIETLGKLRDGTSKYNGKDAVQWLMERLEGTPIEKDDEKNEEARALVWALGRLRDKRANGLVYKKRGESGRNSTFWDRTRIPFSWLPEKRKPGSKPDGPNSASQLYESGMRKCNKGMYPEALADYDQAIKLNPQLPNVYNGRGNVYKNLKKYQKALSDYTQAIKINPQYAETYSNRGLVYSTLKKYQKALSDFNKAIKVNPQLAEAYSNRGNAYQALKEYSKAISDFNQAIKLNPQLAKAYINRGNVYKDLKKYQKALSNYTQAIKLNPKFAEAYNNRGLVYYAEKQYEKALSDYSQAIKLNPRFALAYNNRGLVYYAEKQYEKALLDYTQAIHLNPQYADAYLNRGSLYIDLKKYQKALSDYNQAIKLNPQFADAYSNRAVLFILLKNIPRAIQDFKMLLRLRPNHPSAPKIKKWIQQQEKKR